MMNPTGDIAGLFLISLGTPLTELATSAPLIGTAMIEKLNQKMIA